jgi:ABC-type transporter Mla maintaining outer membrane lipid asymmetry ATPase subunit MlaF
MPETEKQIEIPDQDKPYVDLWGEHKKPPVLIYDDLKIPDETGVLYGPLNLSLEPSEKALIQLENPSSIANILRATLALKKAPKGDVYFLLRKVDVKKDILSRIKVYKQIGLVVELVSLLNDQSAFDNLMTFLLYSSSDDPKILKDKAYEILSNLGFTIELMHTLTPNLNKAYQTLGLLGLAIAKEAPLIIIERPKHFMGRMFYRAWDYLKKNTACQNAGILVLALISEYYNDLDLDVKGVMKP